MDERDDFDRNREDQLTSAPGDKWDDEVAKESIAPRIDVSEGDEGRTRIDIADTAAVRPGAADAADD
ncbi:MAG: multidrug transporter [Naasia sp.]